MEETGIMSRPSHIEGPGTQLSAAVVPSTAAEVPLQPSAEPFPLTTITASHMGATVVPVPPVAIAAAAGTIPVATSPATSVTAATLSLGPATQSKFADAGTVVAPGGSLAPTLAAAVVQCSASAPALAVGAVAPALSTAMISTATEEGGVLTSNSATSAVAPPPAVAKTPPTQSQVKQQPTMTAVQPQADTLVNVGSATPAVAESIVATAAGQPDAAAAANKNNEEDEEEDDQQVISPTVQQLLTVIGEYKKREHMQLSLITSLEAELHETKSLISEYRSCHDIKINCFRAALLDPAINLEVKALRQRLAETETLLRRAKEQLAAQNFSGQSVMGQRLINKCKALQEENNELGRSLAETHLQPLNLKVIALKKHVAFLRTELRQLRELNSDMDRDNEMMAAQLRELSVANSALTAERDQLQAEVERLRQPLQAPPTAPPAYRHHERGRYRRGGGGVGGVGGRIGEDMWVGGGMQQRLPGMDGQPLRRDGGGMYCTQMNPGRYDANMGGGSNRMAMGMDGTGERMSLDGPVGHPRLMGGVPMENNSSGGSNRMVLDRGVVGGRMMMLDGSSNRMAIDNSSSGGNRMMMDSGRIDGMSRLEGGARMTPEGPNRMLMENSGGRSMVMMVDTNRMMLEGARMDGGGRIDGGSRMVADGGTRMDGGTSGWLESSRQEGAGNRMIDGMRPGESTRMMDSGRSHHHHHHYQHHPHHSRSVSSSGGGRRGWALAAEQQQQQPQQQQQQPPPPPAAGDRREEVRHMEGAGGMAAKVKGVGVGGGGGEEVAAGRSAMSAVLDAPGKETAPGARESETKTEGGVAGRSDTAAAAGSVAPVAGTGGGATGVGDYSEKEEKVTGEKGREASAHGEGHAAGGRHGSEGDRWRNSRESSAEEKFRETAEQEREWKGGESSKYSRGGGRSERDMRGLSRSKDRRNKYT